VRLGLLSGPAGGPHLARIIGAFERRHPDCNVQVSDPPFGRQFELLHSGEVDLMATWLPHGQRDLVSGPTLTREPRVLAVAPDHPLAARSEVSLEDVADYRVASVEHFFPRELAETLIPPKAPSGRPIRSVAAAPGQIEHGLMIARGEIVHPTVASVIGFWGGSPEIVCVPLSGLPELRSVLVWRRGANDPRARAFVRVAREVLGEE
jgi:DNA-binding transcriptional LysR family regulator